MKITSVEVFLLDGGNPGWRPIVCRVNTNNGIYGYGEASIGFDVGASASFAMITEIAPFVIGKDPFAIEALWDTMFSDTFWAQNGGITIFSAISAIDTALWDIKAKSLNLPLYQLLGGKSGRKLRCYASQLQFGWGVDGIELNKGYKIEDLTSAAKKAVDEGFDAIKINLITFDDIGNRQGFLRGPITSEVRKMFEKRLAAIRHAIGPDVDILLENHARTDAISAVALNRIAEKYRITFVEEPYTPLNLQVMKTVREKSSIPIAGGERICGRWQYLNLFKEDCLQVVQPDVGTCGGISEAKKICDMAHAFDVAVQLHVCGSPIVIAASLHLAASLPNFYIHEHHVTNRSAANISLGVYDYQPENGSIIAPELPGIGQELSEKAIHEALAYEIIK